MTHQIALNFEDGVTRFVIAREGETIADAAYRERINIPLDCRDGACGTCRCRVEAGDYEPGSYIEDALTADEAAQGYALACQAQPRSDLVVAIAASSDVCKTEAQTRPARLVAVKRLSPTTMAFTLEAGAPLSFLPGQYASVTVPGTDQHRSYSFCSPPGQPRLSFLVRDIPRGVMSSWLRERAVPGTAMTLAGPAGSFYLRPLTRPVVMLAGGTGLAPFLSMLARLGEAGAAYPIHLVYGVTNAADLVELPALAAFAGRMPQFTFSTCVADPASAHPRTGYVTDHLDPAALNDGDVDIYLCGPPAMVEAVRGWLTARSTVPTNFYFEKFSPSGAVTVIGEAHHAGA
ncbi:MAG: benzoate 1,2-dioxygenase electron transfer component BenC [Acetobacteraceae bacterium]